MFGRKGEIAPVGQLVLKPQIRAGKQSIEVNRDDRYSAFPIERKAEVRGESEKETSIAKNVFKDYTSKARNKEKEGTSSRCKGAMSK